MRVKCRRSFLTARNGIVTGQSARDASVAPALLIASRRKLSVIDIWQS